MSCVLGCMMITGLLWAGRPHTNPPLASNVELKQVLCWQLNTEMFEGRK